MESNKANEKISEGDLETLGIEGEEQRRERERESGERRSVTREREMLSKAPLVPSAVERYTR